MAECAICDNDLQKDLFASVTGEPVCCICKQKFIGGMTTTPELIAVARRRLGLKVGEKLHQDNGAEARRILGRRP